MLTGCYGGTSRLLLGETVVRILGLRVGTVQNSGVLYSRYFLALAFC